MRGSIEAKAHVSASESVDLSRKKLHPLFDGQDPPDKPQD